MYRLEETFKLLNAYVNGVKDKLGHVMLVDQIMLRKYKSIEGIKDRCPKCKHSIRDDGYVVKLECNHFLHQQCSNELIMSCELNGCPKEDCMANIH
jgi:hypothetical protein